jgi:hypothetical protein
LTSQARLLRQCFERAVQRLRESKQRINGGVLLTTLNAPYVVSMAVNSFGEGFLGQFELLSPASNSIAEALSMGQSGLPNHEQ